MTGPRQPVTVNDHRFNCGLLVLCVAAVPAGAGLCSTRHVQRHPQQPHRTAHVAGPRSGNQQTRLPAWRLSLLPFPTPPQRFSRMFSPFLSCPSVGQGGGGGLTSLWAVLLKIGMLDHLGETPSRTCRHRTSVWIFSTRVPFDVF